MTNILKATHQGKIDLLGIKISCAVLEDGTRILIDRSVATALGKKGGGAYWEAKKQGKSYLPEYLSATYLRPYISEDLLDKLQNPIQYINISGRETIGIDATLLPQICDVWISARDNGTLTEKQSVSAEKAYLLMKGFATLGIIALVDEATGYQYDRERFELQKILNAYVSEEILKWQLTFTNEFYKEIFRLWGIPFIPKYIEAKPSFIGNLTIKYIYEQLPKGVVDKIKEKIGKTENGNYRYRWHQSLTQDIGREHLKRQIHEVTALMAVSDTKEEFDKLFAKKYKTAPIQLDLEFEENTKKQSKKEHLPQYEPTLFDNAIEKASNFDVKQ